MTIHAAASSPAPGPLTALRADLRLSRGGAPGEGGPAPWLLYDPLAHRYFELDATGLALFEAWQPGLGIEAFAARAAARLGRPVAPGEAAAFKALAETSGLAAAPGGWPDLARRARAGRHGIAAWLLHNYLFVRWPLVRPQAFLERTLPLVRPLAGRTSLALVAGAGLLGLYLAAGQWDAFSATFLHFLTPGGIAGYLLALALVKGLHELGHAYTAVRYGCRVPSMGVALMILVPVLYTDTTDAWRLRDRRRRVAIVAAGVAVEVAVAALATLAWSFLPDGVPRSAAFFLATTSWLMSLAINLSPLMRFDGYYLACDLFGIPNLQPRAFALTRWALREGLFGLGDPCPEGWSARRRAGVIAYGVAVWIYRLVLFTGIAVMVYAMTFKILGLLLFAVEIGVFVLRPIAGEVAFWWRARGRIDPRGRARVTGICAAGLVLALVLPIWSRVEIPAVAEPEHSQRLTAAAPARIESVSVGAGEAVAAGDVLMRLASPELDHALIAARTRLALADLRRDRRAADPADRANGPVLEHEGEAAREVVAGLERRRGELVLRAGFDGVVADLAPGLHPGRWVGRGEDLGALVSHGRRQVRGLVPEGDVARLYPGAPGRFVPDDPTRPSVSVQVSATAPTGAAIVDIPALSSTLGGPVAAREERGLGPVPVEAQYAVLLHRPDDDLRLTGSPEVVRGVVSVAGLPESLAGRALRRIVGVLVRESGF